MAGTVMHLVIADKLLDKLNIQNPALFYCGNLAPDAIMARENYHREMKNHTHFKDGIGLEMHRFREKEIFDSYMVKLMDFYKSIFGDEPDEYYELYLGYIVHILTDELYLLSYYSDFLDLLDEMGKEYFDEEFCRGYIADVDLVDWELVRTYRFRYDMPDILLSENDYEIPGWITRDELMDSKSFIIDKNFINQHERVPLNVTTYQKNYDFINLCVRKIPELLRERFELV